MPSSPFKTKSFHLSSLDRELLDPDHGGLQDISWWYRAYFDGELYPWQHYLGFDAKATMNPPIAEVQTRIGTVLPCRSFPGAEPLHDPT